MTKVKLGSTDVQGADKELTAELSVICDLAPLFGLLVDRLMPNRQDSFKPIPSKETV